jgi:DNA-binding response OmpR family regulator
VTSFAPGTVILVVEDEALIGLDLTMTLEEAGAIVVGPIATVAAALSVVETSRLSAAILDVRLGAEEVGPVAAVLAAKGVPFLFHTGHGNSKELTSWRDRPIVQKPASPEMVLAALHEILGIQ